VVSVADVCRFAAKLPLAYEVHVRGRRKFRVGRIVFLAFSRDEKVMGFGFPKEQREWLVGGDPGKFQMPPAADLRYHWVEARLDALQRAEMEELVLDAWRMVVPKRVSSGLSASARAPRPPGRRPAS
jgi:hypothetical protein